MELLILIIGGGGILGFLGTIITLFATGKGRNAEVNKLISETEKNRVQSQKEMQAEINDLRRQNSELFSDRKLLQFEKDEMRKEIDRMRIRIEVLERQLEDRNSNDLETLKKEVSIIKKQTGQLPGRDDLANRETSC